MPLPKIGDTVIYTAEPEAVDPHCPVQPPPQEWPALVYKLYSNTMFLGLYIFTNDGMRMLRKVTWSMTGEPTPETWRHK